MARPAGPTLKTQIRTILTHAGDRIAALVERVPNGDGEAALRARVLSAVNSWVGGRAAKGPGRPRKAAASRRVKKPASRKQAAARKLQGRYMGSMRSLPKGDVAKVKAERDKNGVVAAIKMAEGMKRRQKAA